MSSPKRVQYPFTSWKKLLSGYKLLKAILKLVGDTGSYFASPDSTHNAVKISNNSQTTQGSPT